MSDDEMDTLGPEGQGSARVDRDRRAPRFSWTPAYEATFFRSLCDSVQLGLRENSSFKAEAWERAMQALQETHGAHPAKSHLINKSDNARKRFRLWRGLREDPEFVYNPVARTVSASEDAWKAHIEREPLSRALRGRPFEHEDYMETLYPDVIGSGGAPKRVMKPRRRTDGTLVEDSEMPGTGVLNLQQPGGVVQPGMLDAFPQSRPSLQQTPSGSSSGSMASQRSASVNNFAMTVPPMGTTAALTPPDEIGSTGSRKRSYHTAQAAMDPTGSGSMPGPHGQMHAPTIAEKRRRTSTHGTPSGSNSTPRGAAVGLGTPLATPLDGSTLHGRPEGEAQSTLEDIVGALRAGVKMAQWREQALDMFFRDFADEDLDLQVKISEGVLSNEGKAMVFCKMPVQVRQHWVRRLREMHLRSA
ncbi:myb/SANT-like DNA-binding domain-containing protein [Sarocladium implicatum]|nr:myb/SANT-like DNA-binding domain-containing protein [Sarocladium implicatum]